jgi:hypothetical protein
MQVWDVLRPGIDFYCTHLVRVINFLGALFVKSPFFVTKDDVERVGGAEGGALSCGIHFHAYGCLTLGAHT